jgi:hypothetical protein
MINKPLMNTLWRDDPATPEGKYLVKRRDGSVPTWPSFVLGARDPAAPAALRAYADAAEALGMPDGFVAGVRRLAAQFEAYRLKHGRGDPERGKHRVDDPTTVEEMRKGQSA